MLGHKNQAWITTALTNQDVGRAILLCSSLRRTFTSRRIAVIASPIISMDLQNALTYKFDLVFFLNEKQNPTNLTFPEFAKLYSILALNSFDVCVYLEPTMLALKNCDEMFALPVQSFVVPKTSLSVFMFKPGTNVFKALATELRDCVEPKQKLSLKKLLENWIVKQQQDIVYLPERFCYLMTPGKHTLAFEDQVAMVDLKEYCESSGITADLCATGLFGKLVGIYRQKLWIQDASPMMKSLSTSTCDHAGSSTKLLAFTKEPIAIVGMSCRFPGANNLEEFWSTLFDAKDCTGNPPDFRWTRENTPKYQPEARQTHAGFLKVQIDKFDGDFFGISAKDLEMLDPQHRLLHELVWEALENACINPCSLYNTSGSVFVGSWTKDFRGILKEAGKSDYLQLHMGNSIGASASQISFLLGITGPSIATESGCSSAMIAVNLACKSLHKEETNLALACGVNLLLEPFLPSNWNMVLSSDGHCKTFSQDANGFARAEGGGVLVLKRFSDAVKDGDHIWALIRGSATAQEGISKCLSTPTAECEAQVMQKALQDADVNPDQVSFVEAHGTGTVVGDPLEIAAIGKAYHSVKRKQPLIIGSVKTNVGHTESCSGIAGIMRVVLCMQNQVITKHINFNNLNPACNLDAIPAVLPLQRMPWNKQENERRIAGVNSFGITGSYAHVIVEESPEAEIGQRALAANKLQQERPLHLLKISAKTETAMDILLESYKSLLESQAGSLADIAFSANTGRADFPARVAILAKTSKDACEQISEQMFFRENEANKEKLGKICFLFTGQGSQFVGMGKQLYETSPVFQMNFNYLTSILESEYHINILPVLWSTNSKSNEISNTLYSQTCIFCLEYALLKLWESWGVQPDCVLGHSLGEFTAAVSAKIISVEDALKLVVTRSKLIHRLSPGRMLVVKGNKMKVERVLKAFLDVNPGKCLDIAAINSHEQTVVAGCVEGINDFAKFCEKQEIKFVLLNASHAFHSKHMDPILEEYKTVAQSIVIKTEDGTYLPKYISGMLGETMSPNQLNSDYWVRHTRDLVNFLDASQTAVKLGCNTFIEIGPQPVLCAFTMVNNEKVEDLNCLPSLKRKEADWRVMLSSLGQLYVKGGDISWHGVDMFLQRKKVKLPTYPFIGQKHWPEVRQSTKDQIHPLLGSEIENASCIKLFKSTFSLNSHAWIEHHRIERHAILPGAAFLEISLAAGLAATQQLVGKNKRQIVFRPMTVKNLVILAPMVVEKGKLTKLQTIVEYNPNADPDDSEGFKVQICEKVEDETERIANWLPHATAICSPSVSKADKFISYNKEGIHRLIETKPLADLRTVEQIYNQLASLGLKFGPMFRSIESLWDDAGITHRNLLAKVKRLKLETESDEIEHIIHPVLIDAMIQAILMLKISGNQTQKKFQVPIRIDKFVWFPETKCTHDDNLYIQVSEINPDNRNDISTENCLAVLLNSNGIVLALLDGVYFRETTCRTIQAVLDQQANPMPELWEEQWRHEKGVLEDSCDLKILLQAVTSINSGSLKALNECPEAIQTIYQLNKVSYYYILVALHECGWSPRINERIEIDTLQDELKIVAKMRKQFQYFLRVLVEEGILEKIQGTTFKIVKLPPNIAKVRSKLSKPSSRHDLATVYAIFKKVGQNLSAILQGTENGLNVLFPEEEESSTSVTAFYTEVAEMMRILEFIHTYTFIWSEFRKAVKGKDKQIPVLKVLEIGAGTGGYTEPILEALESCALAYEYTFTDISPSFFPGAERRFESKRSQMVFKKLDIEKDPIAQGFIPGYYDMVLALDVIHATKDVTQSLTNVYTLLKPGGFLDMIETITQSRFLSYIFGNLEGFWWFTDTKIRPDHCLLSAQGWTKVLENVGFQVLDIYPCAGNHHGIIKSIKPDTITREILSMEKCFKTWVIFHEPSNNVSNYLLQTIPLLTSNRKLLVVEKSAQFSKPKLEQIFIRPNVEEDYSNLIDVLNSESLMGLIEGFVYCWSLNCSEDPTQNDILQPYYFLTKELRRLKQTSERPLKFLALTKEAIAMADSTMSGYYASTIWGYTRSLKKENSELDCRCIDIGSCVNPQEIFYELWNPKDNYLVAYKSGRRLVAKLSPVKPTINALSPPVGSLRYQLVLPDSNNISDIRLEHLNNFDLQDGQVEVKVNAVGLNFRDVFHVLKPMDEFKDAKSIGLDFAGVVHRVANSTTKWRVGDRVFGIDLEMSAFQSHVVTNQDLLIGIGSNMTYSEAVTLPTAWNTSYYCLIELAKITENDTVLIHAASGGVGLAAIAICQQVGAQIIATAGSNRKHNYLKSLGIQHVFHSRNTEYEQKILKVTNGRGVDVVLNSLTGPGFVEASLNTCANQAHFLEISRRSVWTAEEVKALRPDVEYAILNPLKFFEKAITSHLAKRLSNLLDQNAVEPLPYVQFDGVHVREALQYLQKAKHIGKVVCCMPQLNLENGNVVAKTTLFHANATYLITGGLGGIGLEVCCWMLENGAKYILLAGRQLPNDNVKEEITRLNVQYQSKVLPVQLDVSKFEQCDKLINVQLPKIAYPELRGVMHAAGALSDGFIENQTWDKITIPFSAKIQGTLNLHQLTKHNRKLEHFVLFSSIAAQFGPAGQCNHAAANSFEDSFAHYRHSLGLPATSINWGQWGEVGLAAEIQILGLKPFSKRQGLAALEYILKAQCTQITVLNTESFSILFKTYPHMSSYLESRLGQRESITEDGSSSLQSKGQIFWTKYKTALSNTEKLDVLNHAVKTVLHRILKLNNTELIDNHSDFRELGVDSLMFVEIQNSIQELLGKTLRINSSLLKEHSNVQALSEAMYSLIEETGSDSVGNEYDNVLPTVAHIAELLEEDAKLPLSIIARQEQMKVKIENISQVLLTGVTGTLGPYLLKELCAKTQISQVFCLIRPKLKVSGEQRLKEILENRQLLGQIDMSKVKFIDGNIAEARMGVGDKASWKMLCDEVDAVINCAASVQHVEHYYKSKTVAGKNIRAVNVEGVKHVLEFACTGAKLKHVYHASSIAACLVPDKDGNFLEDWYNCVKDYVGVTTLAYPNTKFASDMLMKQAILERGIPGKVFRFPLIFGDSKTGRFILDQNHLMLRYFFILKHGIIPNDWIPIVGLPVDLCAWATINLFLNPDVPSDIFNILNSLPTGDKEFVKVAEKLGYSVKVVQMEDFSKKVMELTSENSKFAMLKEFYRRDEDVLSHVQSAHALSPEANMKTDTTFVSQKICKYLPQFFENVKTSMEYIYKDMMFAKKEGWLDNNSV